jgi:hypothetical protein
MKSRLYISRFGSVCRFLTGSIYKIDGGLRASELDDRFFSKIPPEPALREPNFTSLRESWNE